MEVTAAELVTLEDRVTLVVAGLCVTASLFAVVEVLGSGHFGRFEARKDWKVESLATAVVLGVVVVVVVNLVVFGNGFSLLD